MEQNFDKVMADKMRSTKATKGILSTLILPILNYQPNFMSHYNLDRNVPVINAEHSK